MSTSPFAAAPSDKLDEILRLAEARLAAQLTVGIAADQRAMTMTSILAAIDAALIGLFAALRSDRALDLTALALLIVGFAVATALAAWSARPVAWEIPGNEPCQWLTDIQSGDSLHNGKASMAGFYDDMIAANEKQICSNSKQIKAAFGIVVLTLIVSAIGVIM